MLYGLGLLPYARRPVTRHLQGTDRAAPRADRMARIDQILTSWKNGKAAPVYVLYGKEEFLRSELLHAAAELLVPDEATRKRLDAFGVCVVGFLSAFGGGTLRDDISVAMSNSYRIFIASDQKSNEDA